MRRKSDLSRTTKRTIIARATENAWHYETAINALSAMLTTAINRISSLTGDDPATIFTSLKETAECSPSTDASSAEPKITTEAVEAPQSA